MLAETDHRFVLGNLGRYTDIVRLKDGRSLTVRFIEPKDADALSSYFRSLSRQSRYNRLMSAVSELPPSELDKALHVGEALGPSFGPEQDGVDAAVTSPHGGGQAAMDLLSVAIAEPPSLAAFPLVDALVPEQLVCVGPGLLADLNLLPLALLGAARVCGALVTPGCHDLAV